RLETCLPTADHGDVDVPVLDVDALRSRPLRIELAEPRGAAKELLVQRPRPARADERLVVEARRRERPAQLVRDLHQILVERAAVVRPFHDRALGRGGGAEAEVRDPVARHLAVGAVAGTALEPAGAVVLEAA